MSVGHVPPLDFSHADAVWGVAWTAADTVVSVGADGALKQWVATGQRHPPNAPPAAAHTLGLVSLSVSPDGRHALSNSLEGLTCLWDLPRGEVVARFESYARATDGAEPSWAVSLHPGGETYAATGGAGNVVVYSAQAESFGQRVATLTSGRSKFGLTCKHSPDGRRIALASETGQIYVFDIEAGALSTTYTSHALSVRALAWSADSSLLLSASEDKRLVLHDARAAAGGAVAALTGHASWVVSADMSQDGRLGLSGSADRTIKDTGEVWAVGWRPGGTGAFVSGGEDGVVRWWRGAGAAV
ncbi:WD40-repeat-containing domain protein [Mycena sp. CBHHK59/15]|nr:WD40-repeat-containing domain protein [Mycena sp. CBHHK59/15]